MDRAEVPVLWAFMAETWSGPGGWPWPADDAQQRVREQVWLDQLADIDAGLVRAALVTLAGSAYPPRVGQIRAEALRLADPDPIGDADEAWEEVRTAMGAYGYTGRPEWSSEAVAAAVRALGWAALCQSSEPQTDRAHFIRFYTAAADRIRRQRQLPPKAAELAAPAASRALTARSAPGGLLAAQDEPADPAGRERIRGMLGQIGRKADDV